MIATFHKGIIHSESRKLVLTGITTAKKVFESMSIFASTSEPRLVFIVLFDGLNEFYWIKTFLV